MGITPLIQKQNNVYVSKVASGSIVYATDTDHNLTRGKEYYVINQAYGDILIRNDIDNEEWYSSEWFSLTKPF